MAISAQQVKDLREKTGAAMMDCKRALEEANGDDEKATILLREKGLAKAGKKGSRTTKEGIIGSYIHPTNRLGVLVEVACETDFVARNEEFTALVKELTLQVAAMKPEVVRREELPEEVVEREKAIIAAQAEGKPPQVVAKMVEGKIEKFYSQVCLLDQDYVRDDSKKIKELIDETIGKLGEKIEVRRFAILEVGAAQE